MPSKESQHRINRKFQVLFEQHPQPMWLFDAREGRIVEANRAASELYGYAREEFRGMALANLEAGGEIGVTAAAHTHRTRSGRLIEVAMTSRPFAYGTRRAELVVLSDVTGQRMLEEQLRQARKMEAVGMLAGGVAHDFNNLLTIITGYSQLILNNLPPGDPNHGSAEQILKAAERAAALTGQLLTFSRRQVVQPKVLDLNRLIDSLSSMLRRLIGEHIDLRLNLRSDLGQVRADAGQIEQVLMNLVVNARDAMPRGGTLKIDTGNVRLGENYQGRHLEAKPGLYTMIEVSDTGSGMDEATQARLFEPFFTTKSSGHGTGLGLSTVFSIVKQSAGSVEVYSVPGKGTSVKVYLPRIDQPLAVEPPALAQRAGRGTGTILLVEDEEMVRDLMRESLAGAGYRVIDAAGPAAALALAESFRGDIHLLITDVVMPGMSGRDLADGVTRKRVDIKVLYMSGHADTELTESGILRPKVAFLQKPFTPAVLIEKVREILDTNGLTRKAHE
ncbi:MAG: response regulator [Acidobacteria bacterium]|nr:response regulator [Acidobacteriota bacterium]